MFRFWGKKKKADEYGDRVKQEAFIYDNSSSFFKALKRMSADDLRNNKWLHSSCCRCCCLGARKKE